MVQALILKKKLVLALAAAAAVAVAGTAAAASGGTRPGWGFGDTNHVHTGPPGQSVSVHP